ncbi:MAG: DUF488 family protein [Syntrophales bacterium]
MKVFTVGYGGRKKEEFLALMRNNGIRSIIDVRLRPDRSSLGIFVRAKTSNKGIENWLSEAGIGYRSLIELGNVFLEFADWQERYRKLLESSGELLTCRLVGIPDPWCLLCAEKRVAECHRHLIAEYLTKYKGYEVHHLE